MLRINGFSLIEVLLSLVILSFGLLGLLELQTASIRYGYHAMLHAQGETQIINLAQEYQLTPHPNINEWEQANLRYLPSSHSTIDLQRITLSWQAYQQPDQLILNKPN